MKVICAGHMKTGTKTLCAALRILGYTVYDYEEQFLFLRSPLMKAMNYGCCAEEYREMFRGVDAVTDQPACILWEELYRAFPESKVVFTMRTNEDEWVKSALHQLKVIRSNTWLRLMLMLSWTGILLQQYANSVNRFVFNIAPSSPWNRAPVNEKSAMMRYREHNANVLMNASKERLLHFDLKDGWGPLCQFLDLPVPDQPFPHRNKRGEILGELMKESMLFNRAKREIAISLSVIFVALACVLYWCFL